MQFSKILILAFAAFTTAAPAPALTPAPTTDVAEYHNGIAVRQPAEIEKRLIVLTILGLVGSAAITAVVTQAITEGVDVVKELQDFSAAREAFTQATTAAMFAKRGAFPGVVCYNQGYTVNDDALVDGKVSARLDLGILNVDYDCMYLHTGAKFTTNGDGGFINYSARTVAPCVFDQKTGDVSC